MFYTIYKTVHIESGKEYIGMHKTDDLNDGYLGSGLILKRAIKKHGTDKFRKEILFVFDNHGDMVSKEKELVNEEYHRRDNTYNIKSGGMGGFTSENAKLGRKNANANGALEKAAEALVEKRKDPEWVANKLAKYSESIKEYYKTNRGHTYGRSHTDETKQKMSEIASKRVGAKSSQHGTMWITNGTINKKIKKDLDTIPDGWYKGRV